MTLEQRQLLLRILQSRHFAYADSLKRILEFLCESALGPDAQPVKEYAIAVTALRRPDSFDPKTDPVVRVSVASIRERLRAYFAGEGQAETLTLSIPKGRYQALFAEREATLAAAGVAGHVELRRFWAPYAGAGAQNLVTYTEPLFYRDDDRGVYVRNIYLNDAKTPLDEVRKMLPVADDLSLRPSYHYLSSGEMQASICLTRMFQEIGLGLDMRNVRLLSLNDCRSANLILLGSVRTNHLVEALAGGQGLLMTETTLEDPQTGRVLQGARYLDGKLRRATDYVLVTRRPGLSPGTTITLVASHHGRAVQGIGTLLTLEPQVAALHEAMGLAPGAALPAHFQVLFEVEMIDLDDEVVSTRYLSHQIFEPKR